MERLVKFFINNPKFNYFLFFTIFIIGIYSYEHMPKELFPNTSLDIVQVSGGYKGTSINTLDKMIVQDLETDILSIEDIKELDTVIRNGDFVILATLKENSDIRSVIDDIDISIKKYKINLPPDMADPIAIEQDVIRPVIYVTVSTDKKSKIDLIETANKLKTDLFQIKGIGAIEIYGDNDEIIEFVLDEDKIQTYNLSVEQVVSAISSLSYTFPVGVIKDNKKGHFYISMNNGNKSINEFLNTLLKINGKNIYLKNIAKPYNTLKEDTTIAIKNKKESIILSISQLDTANAITLVEDIKDKIKEENKLRTDYTFTTYNDKSVSIKERLNTVVSNILFGLILVVLALYLLINKRLSFVIGLGIPTSFVIAFFIADQMGYSINIVSLLGLLIALGIVVDDAIVVGENIQKYVEQGMSNREAAFKGSMEMFEPVFLASLTTLFAFMPMLMISGEIGKFIALIPIMVSFLIVASLIESFIFLPIHAEHTLSAKDKPTSWEWINKKYFKLLHYTIHFKKTFLVLYFILIPLGTIFILKNSSFQIFPEFDASEFVISGDIDKNNDLKSTKEKISFLTNYLEDNKKEYFIQSLTTIIGEKQLVDKSIEHGENMFKIDVELEQNAPQNFMDRYVNPWLSFEKIEKGNRTKTSKEIAKELRIKLKELDKKNELKSLKILETKAGPIKTDIKISLISENDKIIIKYLNKLKNKLESIKGVKDIAVDLELGIPEYKMKINKYGESLGLSEKYIGSYLSNLYLENKRFNIFTDKDLIEVNFVTKNEDNLDKLKNIIIKTPDGKNIYLKNVVSFNRKDNFIKVLKEEGYKIKNIYANVDTKYITGTEVLEKLTPLINEIKKNNIKVKFGGEKEKQDGFKKDLLNAVILSLMLITLAMLYMFKKFLYVFIVVSVIPFSIIGALLGHLAMGLNLSMPSMIGILGLAGVVINDSIIMLSILTKSTNSNEFFEYAEQRFRPIMLTSITTLIGLSTLIFFATGQSVILQPIAVSLGFGLLWGTIINLFYVPALFATINGYKYDEKKY